MVSLEDCIAFCGLDENEVAAISEHEHIPEIAATALADYLLKQPHGGETIRTMIIDDIHKALDWAVSGMRRNCSWRCVISSTSILRRAPAWSHNGAAANPARTAIAA